MANRIKVWMLPLAILAYAAIAVAVSPSAYGAVFKSYLTQVLVLPFLLTFALPIASILLRPRAPFSMMMEVLRMATPRLLAVTALFCIGISGFTAFKLAIPHFVPFYADAFLADLDHLLHGGDPGAIVHALLPSWTEYPLAYLYGPIWFSLWFGLLAFVSLLDNAALRTRYFWSMALTVCLIGTVAATAFSSVGPIFYAEFVDPDRFAELVATIKASAFGDYMTEASGYLLANYQSQTAGMGTGISALPSMHLAIVTLNACMLTSLNRYVGILGWIYVGLIQIGSVYLGWHYAVDGYFSIAVVSLIWWGVGKVLQADSAGKEGSPTPLPQGLATS